MSYEIARQALSFWHLENASLSLIADRENHVYRVDDQHLQTTWALRVHRAGLRTHSELQSESQWMQALGKAGLSVPYPVVSSNGHLCEEINSQWVDMQTWLPGETLSTRESEAIYRLLGHAMAQLHTASDAWKLPPTFDRPAWDLDGLLGTEPVWDRFWENPYLDTQQQTLLRRFRAAATQALHTDCQTLDFGLIHADLVSENVLIDLDADHLHLIDFDDSGFGYRLFDLATVILRLQRNPTHEKYTYALIDGYMSTRPLDMGALDLFLALRACTYIGWIITRIDEETGEQRCVKYIETGCNYVKRWLDSQSASTFHTE